ncbi:preprotein translocase subunit SecG [Agrilactobacillus yilanensis]|uniref:Protein-export membrane protein SecG n=1 Tax=Agrilactobacillus yilanensis TaxID=2485997 RepID=A0ABW4JC70_9LACO|nr:preprotein translocase subunit SecG [Agrilactobacillus yilanensis]
MYNVIQTLLIIDCFLIIIAVMMQPSKQQDALSALSGGGNELQSGGTKKRGFEAFMVKVTWILGILFFIFSLILVYLSSNG